MKIKKFIPVILGFYMFFILGFSFFPDESTPGSAMAWVAPQIQNLLHIPAFGILALLWGWTFQIHAFSEKKSLVFASLLAAGIGLVSEIGQIWVPGRYASLTDFLFDLIGIAVIWPVYRWLNLQRCFEGLRHA